MPGESKHNNLTGDIYFCMFIFTNKIRTFNYSWLFVSNMHGTLKVSSRFFHLPYNTFCCVLLDLTHGAIPVPWRARDVRQYILLNPTLPCQLVALYSYIPRTGRWGMSPSASSTQISRVQCTSDPHHGVLVYSHNVWSRWIHATGGNLTVPRGLLS